MKIETRNHLEPYVSPLSGLIRKLFIYSTSKTDSDIFTFFVDYPQYEKYTNFDSTIKLRPGASALNKEDASLKAMGETLERYALAFEQNCENTKLKHAVNSTALKIRDVKWFHESQYGEKYSSPVKSDYFKFIEGRTIEGDKILFPEQLICFTKRRRSEKNIGYSFSTGCATGYSHKETIIKGILEQVERDSALFSWYKKDSFEYLDLNSSDKVKDLSEKLQLKRFLLLDTTTDINIPSILGITWDKEGDVAFSFAASNSMEEAAIDALKELAQMKVNNKRILLSGEDVSDTSGFSIDQFRNERLGDSKAINCKKITNQQIISRIQDHGHKIAVFDVTTPDLDEQDLKVTKTVIPSLCQFGKQDEMFLGQERIQKLLDSSIENVEPPPFLH